MHSEWGRCGDEHYYDRQYRSVKKRVEGRIEITKRSKSTWDVTISYYDHSFTVVLSGLLRDIKPYSIQLLDQYITERKVKDGDPC